MATFSLFRKLRASWPIQLVLDSRNNWSEVWEEHHQESQDRYASPCITRYAYERLDKEGNSQLHLACRDGSYGSVKKIVNGDLERNLCCSKDKDGNTPMHIAAKKGKVEVLQLLLVAYPASIEEVNAAIETCLHTAVVYNKGKTIQFLLTWLARNSDYAHLINSKDYDGNTALHLATSRQQLQTLKVFLGLDPNMSRWVQVNARNFSGFTALDILYVLPHTGKINLEIEKILRKAGALTTKNNVDCDTHVCLNRQGKKSSINVRSRTYRFTRPVSTDVLLVVATLVATVNFHAALSFPSLITRSTIGSLLAFTFLNQGDSITTQSFVLFNSIGFIASVAVIIFQLHRFPMKPWPQISVSTLFGSYMCIINVISPSQALPLFSLSVPFLLLAAAGKLFCFQPKGFT